MDDANEIRFRNGKLTAQVQMLTSRLDDANNANTYLLNQVSSRANDQLITDIARLEQQHKKTLRENIQLKAHLGITRRRSALNSFTSKNNAFTLKAKRDSMTTNFAEDSADFLTEDDDDLLLTSFRSKLRLRKNKTSIVDSFDSLVDLSEHQVLVPQPAVEEKVEIPTPKKPEKPQEIDYGLGNLRERTTRPIWEYPPDTKDGVKAPYDGTVDRLGPGFDIHQYDGTITHVPMPFYPKSNTTRVYSNRPEFNDTEHNRLSGNAVFIEAMEGRELVKYWQQRARESPKHTAREWRQYYEENIRPGHLEKMRLRAEGSPATPPESSQKVTPASTEASKILESHASTEEKKQVTAENIEAVEGPSPSAITAIHDQQPTVAETKLETESLEVTSLVESDHTNFVPEVSRPGSSVTFPQPEVVRETVDLAEEKKSVKSAPPLQKSTANEEVILDLQPLPGLPEFPPYVYNRRPSTFQQVTAGNYPTQQSGVDQQKVVAPRSKFMDRSIIPAVNSTSMVEEPRASFDSRRLRGGRVPHQRTGQEFTRDDTQPSQQPFFPDCIEDLFAKPAFFHADPLAFRSVIMTIPPSVNFSTALSKIIFPGATLFSSSYLRTSQQNLTPRSTTNHILLVFLSGVVTQEFIKQYAITPIQHFCSSTNTMISSKTTLLPTATHPIPSHTQSDILSQNLTRVLYISCPGGIGRHATPLTAEAAWRSLVQHRRVGDAKDPLCYRQDSSTGKLYWEFASMKDSKAAWELVGRHSQCCFESTTEFGFAADPCDQTEEGSVVEDGKVIDGGVQTVEEVSEEINVKNAKEDAEIVELRAIENMEGLAHSTGDNSPMNIKSVFMEDNCTTSKEFSEVGVSVEYARSFGRETSALKDGKDKFKADGILGDCTMTAVNGEGNGVEMEAEAKEMEE